MKKLIKEKRLLEEKTKKLRRERLWLFLRQEQIKENLVKKVIKKPKA